MEISERELERELERIFEKNNGPIQGTNPTSGLTLVTEDAGSYEAGSFFEAETKQGNKNYIIFARVHNGFVYYFHGDKAKKVNLVHFKKLISHGDLVFVPKEKVDIEKAALAVLGINAMLNGLSFNDYLKVCFNFGDGSRA